MHKVKALRTTDFSAQLLAEKNCNSKKGQKIEAHTVLVQTVINKEWVMTPELDSINLSLLE